ncbi:MAG: PDZ domain-containing protein [Acidobacteriota bacterium]
MPATLVFLVLGAGGLSAVAPPAVRPAVPVTLTLELFPGRGEARVTESAGADAGDHVRSYRSTVDTSRFRIEPGNSYLFPSSLWDRFAGSRHGPFRIEVVTRADEAVLASGYRIAREDADAPGLARTVFAGEERDRGVGLYVLARAAGPDGEFPAAPPWATGFLQPILDDLSARFGPLAGQPPRVAVVDFPRRMAKAFPGALVLDRRLALGDGAPPAGRLAILAHEAAHLWWANGVRTTGPGASALQEGLAEYAACRVIGSLVGPSAETARWQALKDEYVMASEAIADAGATVENEQGARWPGRAVRYARAAWIIRMLELRIGHQAFTTGLKDLMNQGDPVDWLRLIEVMSAVSGVRLDAFETGWIRGSGHPDPHVTVNADGEVSIENRGRGAGEFPLEQSCHGGHGIRAERFVSIGAGRTATIELPDRGCTVRVDPRQSFLLGARGPTAPPGLVMGRAWGFPVVRGVEDESAAARAGLQSGDLIVEADGQPLDEGDVRAVLGRMNSGREIHLRVRRGHTVLELVFGSTAGVAGPPS